jgi:hypothetical protein
MASPTLAAHGVEDVFTGNIFQSHQWREQSSWSSDSSLGQARIVRRKYVVPLGGFTA